MNTARSSSRRILRRSAVAGMAALAVGLSACAVPGGSATPVADDPDEPASIRFYWWGSDARNERMQQAIDLFEEDNPNITVTGEFAEWGGYWDKLATSVVGGDTPDVFMQEDRYIADYARRGILADLGAIGVETGDIDESLLTAGAIDGTQFGIPTGSNVYSVIANPALFEAAGVELPDDDTWTWDDYVDIATRIHDGTPGGQVYGTSDATYNEVGFSVYARQHGQSLFDEDGELGYDDDLLEEWFQRSLDLQASGGQPPADSAASLDLLDSPIAKGYAAMNITWSAQLGALSTAVGQDLTILKMPGESEFTKPGMFYKPGMYLSASAKTKHPSAVAKFIDFFANDPRVGGIFLTELGLPGNAPVREAILPKLTPVDQKSADFVAGLADHIVSAPPALPNGAGEVATIIQRINEQVLFGQLTPADAAKQFRSEVEAVIG
ncbi:ABC transporter substrate-binding protein [Microbacterium ulmi]|uniref:Extracellular solute-binding protein n=1 Tax=Microbacterium ulmi TaxID=179095 RepID=A0A7Y2M1Z7_9MICO|nr:extracellular solute-binding protein [Microbacterium ulmi]NII68587.1 multiple sugar transport system substrate-binding protein [Microbacterium ulmi]NNH05040.1 extracellular solute-binding protein [Microbacterium ulmi]